MKTVGVIPARYRSMRFEGKPLALIGGRPMIEHVWDRASRSDRLDELIVATDDERIAKAVRGFGGRVAMTSPDHPSGTDRVAEVAASLDADVIVNVQGDEPFVSSAELDELVAPFEERPGLEMATLKRKIEDDSLLADPNVVKVVTDLAGFALYFSRSLIPYPRRGIRPHAFEHIGIYAYTRVFLAELAAMSPTTLEQTEGLEQLRVLEHGRRISVVETDHHVGLSVDTPEELERAEVFLAESNQG